VRAALALLLAAASAACGLPEKARALVAPKPTPTVVVPTPTPVPVPPLAMEFVRIREERARGSAGAPSCMLEIELGGAKREEIAAARVVVKTAVDDLGTNLITDDAATAGFAPLPEGAPGAPVVLSVPTKVAARSATTLREVSGEIELQVAGAVHRYRFSLKDVPLP
jgi:hypothetical protein